MVRQDAAQNNIRHRHIHTMCVCARMRYVRTCACVCSVQQQLTNCPSHCECNLIPLIEPCGFNLWRACMAPHSGGLPMQSSLPPSGHLDLGSTPSVPYISNQCHISAQISPTACISNQGRVSFESTVV
jgi:hypothetical protein